MLLVQTLRQSFKPTLNNNYLGFNNIRKYTTNTETNYVVKFHKFCGPKDELKLEKEDFVVPTLQEGEVLLKFIAAPINPADLNFVQGNYGSKPTTFPAIAGNEGVAVVKSVGPSVTNLKIDDWVIPAVANFGTWRNFTVSKSDKLIRVPNTLKPEYAATLAINPCTAVRLLEDFVKLKPGDVVIQNAANSTVGWSVIQIAKQLGLTTINVIRDRDFGLQGELIERLKGYGANIVVTEEYLKGHEFQRLISDLPKPKLALNATGGSSATELARNLGEGGVLVTYGGMSRQPIVLPTGPFIFKDIALRGFWFSRWIATHSIEERTAMVDKVVKFIQDKQLTLWLERVKFTDFAAALEKSQKEKKDRKIVLIMDSSK